MSTNVTSAVKMRVQFRTRIDKMCDSGNDRYGLANVLVTKGPNDGELFATATDDRALAIAFCDGTTDEPHYVPKSAFHNAKFQEVQLNGVIETRSGTRAKMKRTVADVEQDAGRYPNVTSVVEEIKDARNYEQITIDPELLLRVAQAVNDQTGETKGVRLFVPKRLEKYDEAGDKQEHYPEGTVIKVVGEKGIGVIMPMSDAGNTDVDRYNWFVRNYKPTFAQAAEWTPPTEKKSE